VGEHESVWREHEFTRHVPFRTAQLCRVDLDKLRWNLSGATQAISVFADPTRAIPSHGNRAGSVGVNTIAPMERGPLAIGALTGSGCRVPRSIEASNGVDSSAGSRAAEQTERTIPLPVNRAQSIFVLAETWIRRRRRTTLAVAFISVSVIFTMHTREFFLALSINANTVVAPIVQKRTLLVNRTTV
jgi:hypothetical protein